MEADLPKTSAAGPHVSDTIYTQESKHGQSLIATALHENNDARSRDTSALRHKVDLHLVPIMFLCYLMNFIDKVALNYAAVMGLNKDLKLQANEFSNVATAFFAAYLLKVKGNRTT